MKELTTCKRKPIHAEQSEGQKHLRLLAALLFCMHLAACGGSSGKEDTSNLPIDTPPAPLVVSAPSVSEITPYTATISFTTSNSVPVSVSISPAYYSEEQEPIATYTSEGTTHSIAVSKLWSDTLFKVQVSASDQVKTAEFSSAEPEWSDICRTGQMRLQIMPDAQWSSYRDENSQVSIASAPDCDETGTATTFNFDLKQGEWVVAARSTPFATPIDLSSYSHLWIPYKGQENVPVAFEVKLKDVNGSLSVVRLNGGTGLPVWRSWAVDLREFKSQVGELDITRISSLEFAFSMPRTQSGARKGRVDVGDLWAWNINDISSQRESFEEIKPNPEQLSAIASDLLSRQRQHGFIPAWYELTPNWHLYANAMALIVFTLEYERLEAIEDNRSTLFLDAANKLTNALVELQSLSNRQGAWDDSFQVVNNRLSIKAESQRDFWVGSTAWAGIALVLARDVLPDGQRLDENIQAVSQYYQSHQQCRAEASLPPGSITEGTEGNISTHLFLMAAQERGLADKQSTDLLGSFISDELFDNQQRRFFCGVGVDFGSGFDVQTCSTNGTGDIVHRDASACLDVMANWGSQWLVENDRIDDAMRGLVIGRDIFATQDFASSGIKGLGDIAGPWSPTVEHGAGQFAAQGGPDANFILNQANQYLCSQGKCQGASNDFSAGIGWNTTANGIAPAAWMYLAWHGQFWEKL